MEEAFERKAWHGPNLRGAIRGLDPAVACHRPGPGATASGSSSCTPPYWKYAVRRRLVGEQARLVLLQGQQLVLAARRAVTGGPGPRTSRCW
jgi:hypothetical protein